MQLATFAAGAALLFGSCAPKNNSDSQEMSNTPGALQVTDTFKKHLAEFAQRWQAGNEMAGLAVEQFENVNITEEMFRNQYVPLLPAAVRGQGTYRASMYDSAPLTEEQRKVANAQRVCVLNSARETNFGGFVFREPRNSQSYCQFKVSSLGQNTVLSLALSAIQPDGATSVESLINTADLQLSYRMFGLPLNSNLIRIATGGGNTYRVYTLVMGSTFDTYQENVKKQQKTGNATAPMPANAPNTQVGTPPSGPTSAPVSQPVNAQSGLVAKQSACSEETVRRGIVCCDTAEPNFYGCSSKGQGLKCAPGGKELVTYAESRCP